MIRAAIISLLRAASTTAATTISTSSCISFSASIVILCRVPFAGPAGFPDWPFWNIAIPLLCQLDQPRQQPKPSSQDTTAKDHGEPIPGYAPADLLKLYIYGYLNRVRSSRRLEAECHRNIEVIWLLRSLKPDFKTIADFGSDNRAAFKKIFRDFVILCRRLDLFGRELLAVDGTRIKVVNDKDRDFTTGSLQKFIGAVNKNWRVI